MTKKTKTALSSLEWALSQSIDQPRQPDEFTLAEYARELGVSDPTASHRIKNVKGLVKRTSIINGKRTNLYRKA